MNPFFRHIYYYSQGGGETDNTLTYQGEYLDDPGSEFETDFTPADIASLDVWLDMSAVTEADIPGADDLLASIPNLGTGSDASQATAGNRPHYRGSFLSFVEPVWSGAYDLQDSWWKHQQKAMRISSSRRMNVPVVTQNPTYLEGYIVYAPTSSGVMWSHRSETTRLIQVGVNNATGKYEFQLRSSGNSLRTMTSTADALTGELAIIYFRFNKAGNSHAISVNGETEVTDTTNFGAETFNATIQAIGAFNNGTYQNGAAGNCYEFILKYSALSAQDKTDTLQYLRWKYLNAGLSTNPVYTEKTNFQLIRTTDDAKAILEAIADDTHVKFSTGEHLLTDDIVITASNINIEVPTGATIKRADDSTVLQDPEIVFNQLPVADIELRGTYMGADSADYWIKVDANGTPDTFSWQKNSGLVGSQPSPYANTGVAITGDWQLLSDGIEIKFGATTGNTIGSGAIVTIGSGYRIFQVGTGLQADYIENVKIFGEGILNMNQSNNEDHSSHGIDLPYGVLFWGRVRHCGVYGVTIQDTHRTVGVYGEHTGTYNSDGSTTGGESFDAEFIDILHTESDSTIASGHGILIGHPQHRGFMRYVRCNHNIVDTDGTCIEPNFRLSNYMVNENTVTRHDEKVGAAIHCWRRSDNGIVINNTQVNSAHTLVDQSGPQGWEDPVNILEYNNVTE